MRRIKNPRVRWLTLCKRGKNRMPVLYKADDGSDAAQFSALIKASDDFQENGELLAVAYPNEWVDKDNHIADTEVCKEMAYSFMREGANLDIRHNGEKIPLEKAYVAENFIIQKGDPRFDNFKDYDGNEVDVTGSWGVVIKVEDKELRRLYKEEGWNGVSFQGSAELVEEKTSEAVRKAMAFYKAHIEKQGDDDLKPDELAKALADNNTALVTALKEVLKPEAKKEEEKPEQEPVFKGDASDPEAVKKFAKEVKIHNLKKTVDFKDPKAIENYAKQLAEINKADEDDEDSDESEELRNARRIVAKADGLSDAPTRRDPATRGSDKGGKSKLPPVLQSCNLSKEEIEGHDAGKRMADWINKQNEAHKS